MKTNVETPRLKIDVHPGPGSTLADDVRVGLLARPKRLPPKYFYDEAGSILFDRICDTEAYYPTRAEAALLEASAEELVGRFRPTHLVELGSGAARKTRSLLRAFEAHGVEATYVPFDVSESMLRSSAKELLDAFPWLRIHGVVGDYDLHLDRIPREGRRLFAFLGGTIGNFPAEKAEAFLREVASNMQGDDRLLLGTDLVKARETLERAYNDEEGITAAFNKNILQVLNRELDADFDLERFSHLAFFNEEASRVEMHLESSIAQEVRLPRLDLRIPFEAGETIHTEISRKFTRATVEELLSRAGLAMEAWYAPEDRAYGLSVSRPQGRS